MKLDSAFLNTTNASIGAFLAKDGKMRAVVGVSCGLSILGSLLIILSYVLFKTRRTRARKILLQISLMDLGVALAHLIGLSVYFDQYYAKLIYDKYYSRNNSYVLPPYIDGLCKTQAFFDIYCTNAAVLWTISLAGFLYFLIFSDKKSRISTYFLYGSYVVCYALPLLVTMWLVFTDRLGYAPLDSSGWCSLMVTVSYDRAQGWHRYVDRFSSIVGYDLWVYLAFFTITVLYLAIRCHLANVAKEIEQYSTSSKKFWSHLHHVDYKLLLIPVVFVFLRIWSVIQSILYDYIGLHVAQVNPHLIQALLYLSGIGDSSQGFANAIIFVVFTKNIRDSFIKFLCCGRRDGVKDDRNIQVYSAQSHLNVISSSAVLIGDSCKVEDEIVFGKSEENARSQCSSFYCKSKNVKTYGAVS